MARRIARRLAGAGRALEVLVGQLEVMLGGDRLAVAHPLANDVHREFFGQLGFARAPHVLKHLGPGLQAGRPNEVEKPAAEVLVCVAVAGDGVLGAGLGLVKGGFEVGPELGE
jgi:hypothetical protein